MEPVHNKPGALSTPLEHAASAAQLGESGRAPTGRNVSCGVHWFCVGELESRSTVSVLLDRGLRKGEREPTGQVCPVKQEEEAHGKHRWGAAGTRVAVGTPGRAVQ